MVHFQALFLSLALVASVSAVANEGWLKTLNKRWSYNVCQVEALGGGKDDGPNILEAFKNCSSNALIVLDGNYTVGTLLTANLSNVDIALTGTLQYTSNISYWSPNSLYLTYQNATTYFFLSGNNIHLHGPGTIDANGQVWWDALANNQNSGVAGGSSTTFARPIPLTIGNATNVIVDNLTIRNSPFWHNFCYNSKNVIYSNLNLYSVSNNASNPASNSDGIDIYRSDDVVIRNWSVFNDDDCVSFKPNTTNVIVNHLNCTGSHGISVGSLGQYKGETDIVANIYVNDVNMTNAQNGARIKVFPDNPNPNSVTGGGTGYVQNITFQNFQVQNTSYPILIDSCYDVENATFCAQYPSRVNISDVHYINVYGTSSGVNNNTVVQMECSAECYDVTATETHLSPPSTFNSTQYLCRNIASTAELDFNCTAPPS